MKTIHALTEIPNSPPYEEWIASVTQFTIESFRSSSMIEEVQHGISYLLAFWQKMCVSLTTSTARPSWQDELEAKIAEVCFLRPGVPFPCSHAPRSA